MISRDLLPGRPLLVRGTVGGLVHLALWDGARLLDLSASVDPGLRTLDALLGLSRDGARARLEGAAGLPELDPGEMSWAAPAEGQEVWAAGVTYLRSREARIAESAQKDVYAQVYEADRPELFFKAAGWRVVAHGGQVGVRPDSRWDVPEPELAVLSNAAGEIVGYACGNDMSSRSIEGENPLYLPQAKVYQDSCAIGPGVILAWHADPAQAITRMTIERSGEVVFRGEASVGDMVRRPEELVGVLRAAYPLPAGAWLLTGTSIVPPEPYTALAGDVVRIAIEGIGELVNTVHVVPHTGATALPGVERGP